MKKMQKKIKKMKKKRNYNTNNGGCSNNDCDLGFKFVEDEIEVANTLLNLSYIISKSLSNFRYSYFWASKRRRSAVENPPLPPPLTPLPSKEAVAVLSPPPQPPVVAATVVKMQVRSPGTPLDFPTSESDGKSNSSKKRKTPVKRRKEELQQMVDEIIQTRLTLIEKIEKVKLHREKLKAQNYELKSQKPKLMEDFDILKPATEYRDQQGTTVNDRLHESPSASTHFHQPPPLVPHHQGFIINPTIHIEQGFRGQFHYHQQLGPLGFDLNVSAAEMVAIENGLQPLDQRLITKMMMIKFNSSIDLAREARRNRIKIIRSKKPPRVR